MNNYGIDLDVPQSFAPSNSNNSGSPICLRHEIGLRECQPWHAVRRDDHGELPMVVEAVAFTDLGQKIAMDRGVFRSSY